jgi:hypothetical protein
MAQEDRGLVIRGLLLLGLIGGLVTVVLGILFWRSPIPSQTVDRSPPEPFIASMVATLAVPYPAGITWAAVLPRTETLPSAPGWQIRYNAAATLARRGSAAVPWPLIREMLDEKLQMRNYLTRNRDGQDVYDEASARANMISALKAIALWHEKQNADAKRVISPELLDIYTIVDKLTESPFGELKIQAENARKTFFR